MTTTTDESNDIGAALAAAIASNRQEIAALATCDAAYKNEWKRFKKYVDNHPSLSGSPKYLTRNNIDLYFAEVITQRKANANSTKRALWALEHFAKNVE